MKRFAAVSFVALISCALFFGVACADPTPDKIGTFSIEVATGWTVEPDAEVMDLVGPQEIPHVSVIKAPAPNVTMDKFSKVFIAQAKKELSKFTLVSFGKTKVAGVTAGVWVYTARVNGVNLRFRNYVMFKNGTMYNVIFATLPGRYKSDVTGFDCMMKTWKWL